MRKRVSPISVAILLVAFVVASPLFRWGWTQQPSSLTQALNSQTPWALAMQLQTEPQPEIVPFSLLQQVLSEQYPDGRFTGTIAVSPQMGDFLLWRGQSVLVYSPLYWFTASYWSFLEAQMQCQPGWWEVLDQRSVNMIVLKPNDYPQLQRRIEAEPGWLVVHRPGAVGDARFGTFDGWIAIRKKPVLD